MTLAPVTRKETVPVGKGEFDHRALVFATIAMYLLLGEINLYVRISNGIESGRSGRFPNMVIEGRKGCAVCPHQFGNIRTNNLFLEQKFKGTQYSRVAKGAPLGDNFVS